MRIYGSVLPPQAFREYMPEQTCLSASFWSYITLLLPVLQSSRSVMMGAYDAHLYGLYIRGELQEQQAHVFGPSFHVCPSLCLSDDISALQVRSSTGNSQIGGLRG